VQRLTVTQLLVDILAGLFLGRSIYSTSYSEQMGEHCFEPDLTEHTSDTSQKMEE
jgi:hypothetical protein